jgi:hypothetical protein
MRRNFVYEGLAETHYSRDQYVRHLHQGNENQNERGSNESKYYRGLIPSESQDYFEDVMSNEWDAVERCGTPAISWRERKILHYLQKITEKNYNIIMGSGAIGHNYDCNLTQTFIDTIFFPGNLPSRAC